MEETLSSKVIYDGQVIKLRIDTVKSVSGGEATREIVEHRDCVAIVAVDAKDNVLLVKQYRKAVEKELLEIPAGSFEAGENAEDAVKRELQEEAGFLPRQMTKLGGGGFYSSPGFCTEYLHLYLATDLVPSRLVAEDTDEIKVVPTPIGEIRGLITSGRICDSKSIAGLFTYLDYRKSKA